MITPLNGVRVLDLTNVLAGPFCCHQLAHMGAEVIKVEVPGRGDLARQLGADRDLNERLMGVSFLAQNAGKKSITLNLKDARGKDLLRRLVADSHVLVENFRPGVMDRLEVGYEDLRGHNEQLIYCAISGFGQDGPMRDLPAYDQIVQGLSGVMAITGEPDGSGIRVGYPVCDTIGGLTAAFAISAALNGREANGGTFIDVSMLEATLATMGWVVSNWLIAGVRPQAHGNENITSAPSGTFATANGPLNIAANTQAQWETLCRALGQAALIDDPRFRHRDDRKTNRVVLKKTLEVALRRQGAAAWAAELNGAGVPAGVVLNVPEILDHPQVAETGFVTRHEVAGVAGGARIVGSGFKLDGSVPTVESAPPALGADNDAVYGALGLSDDEIETLRREAVI